MRRVTAALAALVMALTLVAGAGAAVDVPVSGEGPFNQSNGPTITFDAGSSTDVNFNDLFPSSDTTRLNTSAGIVEFRSNGETAARITALDINRDGWTNISAVDASQANLTVDPAGHPTYIVGDQLDHVAMRDAGDIALDDGTVDFS
jgi:hypothetical protein